MPRNKHDPVEVKVTLRNIGNGKITAYSVDRGGAQTFGAREGWNDAMETAIETFRFHLADPMVDGKAAYMMRVLTFTPTWRHATKDVMLVEHPTEAWLLGLRHIRFTVLQDGRVLFGNSDEVTHHDACNAGTAILKKGHSVTVGVLMRYGSDSPGADKWRAVSIQHAPTSFNEATIEDVMTARSFLRRVEGWKRLESMIGSVTFMDPLEPAKEIPEVLS